MKKSLTKKQILRLKTDISRVFRLGKSYSLEFLRLICLENDLTYSRFIIVPVRHYGNSVERNTIRRQLRELYRINQDKISTGYDFVIIVYIHTNNTFSKLQKTFITLFKKSGVYE